MQARKPMRVVLSAKSVACAVLATATPIPLKWTTKLPGSLLGGDVVMVSGASAPIFSKQRTELRSDRNGRNLR